MITVFTTCYNRPEVFKLFCDNMASLNPVPPVLVVGSKDDPCAAVAKGYNNVLYVAYEHNLPLGQKNNYACMMAGKYLFADDDEYLLYMGDDNFMSQTMWDYYNKFEGDVLAIKDLYFFDSENSQAYYWHGYRKEYAKKLGDRTDEPLGPCKLMKAAVLRGCNFRPWKDGNTYTTDYDMWKTVKSLTKDIHVVTMAETGGIALDYKTKQNLTSLHKIPDLKPISYHEFIGSSKDIDLLLTQSKL